MNLIIFKFLILFSGLFFCASSLSGQIPSEQSEANVLASTLTVTKTADTSDGACNSDCSLREAIAAANAGDTIVFASPLFDSVQTITLALGQLVINKNLVINGTGAERLMISGNSASRVFSVNGNSTVATISGLTVMNGRQTSLGEVPSWQLGGGILNNGDLTLINVNVTNNVIRGASWLTIQGGGIYSSFRLTLIDSTISNNTLTDEGRPRYGAGIYNGGSMRITRSTISNNGFDSSVNWRYAGGIYNSGDATITNSTISENSSGECRIYCFAGGIWNLGSLTLTNSTVTANFGRAGGGIRNTGTLTLSNTIIAGNSPGSASNRGGPDLDGNAASLGYNLIGDTTAANITGNTTGNILNQNAQLAPLAYNGGLTKTHALLPNSPALNAGGNALAVDENNNPLVTDQRGGVMSRISGSAVDIGAYEVSTAEISVAELGGGNIPDGGSFDFGQTPVFTPLTKTFRITNNGSTTLKLANLRLPAGFTVVSNIPSEITPTGAVNFQVRLDAAVQGAPSGTLSFDTNDNDENPYNFTITGTVGAPPVTSVASITTVTTGQFCTPISLIWRVVFTQPSSGLSTENFSLADVNNSIEGERIAFVTAESSTSYLVYAAIQTGNGQLQLRMVNRNGTNSVISNLPFAGPINDIFASPPVPGIEPLTSLPALPNSTGNQLTTSDSAAAYRWFLTGGSGTITGSDSLQTVTFSAGSAGNMTFSLRVTAANGCFAFNSISIPVYSVPNPVVTNNDDINAGSLRQAILEAAPGSTITFADNVRGTITLTTGELLVEKNLTIRGPGADKLTISGNNQSRIFYNGFGSVLNLEGLTITNGKTDAQSSQTGLGGAIYNHGGTVTIKNSVVSDSTSISNGGGIASLSPNGSSVTIINSAFTGNAASSGGGIYANCPVTIAGSTISGNSTVGEGGGIFVQNTAGINVNLVNSTVANNSAGDKGGGIEVIVNGFGNAVLNSLNSIVAQNTAPTGPDVSGRLISQGNNLVGSSSGMWTEGDQTGNLFNPAGGARLAPLGFYGGATPTHALLSNSPAINAANNCVTNLSCSSNNPPIALTADQRGAARIGQTDIGAFELNSSQNGGNFVAVLPIGSGGRSYSFIIIPDNGSTSYCLASGTLPSGMNLSGITGNCPQQKLASDSIMEQLNNQSVSPAAVVALGGTPMTGGSYSFALKATNGGNENVTNYSLQILAPTAASVSVSGRVFAANNRGLANAVINLTDAQSNTRSARTNTFGYYRFDDVQAGQTIVVSVSSKRYQFAPQVVTISEELTELNFVAQN